MTEDLFMVLELQKIDSNEYMWQYEPALFEDYDTAFDYFNNLAAAETEQVFKKPKVKTPVRVSLKTKDIELWIVKRTDHLIKN
ncbi:MAG: hypothetical protein JST21_00820 [Bacteroidetes bacterium]|nr:hypothetical protein [Bacteroidota bacterium]